jgi:hypothetical protein
MNDEYPRRRIYYYDSDGRLDEMKHTQGKFEGFAPGGPMQ